MNVSADHKEWKGEKGTFYIIEGDLRDAQGTARWSVMCKPENEQALRGVFAGLIGKPGEFTSEQRPDYRGVRQLKQRVALDDRVRTVVRCPLIPERHTLR